MRRKGRSSELAGGRDPETFRQASRNNFALAYVWVRMRTRIQNALQAIALAHGLRRGHSLWSNDGQEKIAVLPLMSHTA